MTRLMQRIFSNLHFLNGKTILERVITHSRIAPKLRKPQFFFGFAQCPSISLLPFFWFISWIQSTLTKSLWSQMVFLPLVPAWPAQRRLRFWLLCLLCPDGTMRFIRPTGTFGPCPFCYGQLHVANLQAVMMNWTQIMNKSSYNEPKRSILTMSRILCSQNVKLQQLRSRDVAKAGKILRPRNPLENWWISLRLFAEILSLEEVMTA